MRYKAIITEILEKEILIEAVDRSDAIETAKSLYDGGLIKLTEEEDLIETNISAHRAE